MAPKPPTQRTIWGTILIYFWTAVGACLVALALKVFLIPSRLIDGGVVGVSMILSALTSEKLLSIYLVVLNIPFVVLAWKQVGKRFVIHMTTAVALLALFSFLMSYAPPFEGDVLEVIVFGGLTLGIGGGLVIRMGGALDGTEIMAIILSKRRGYTVGQVVFFFNIFIFAIAGFVEQDWHSALRSFMTYIVAYKIMDAVIVGLEETKSVMIISAMPRKLTEMLTKKLQLGVTVMYGRGGFSGIDQEILYVIVERLQLAELKQMVNREDPEAFIAVENLHEVFGGKAADAPTRKGGRRRKRPRLIP